MKWSTTISFVLAAGGVLALAALVTHEKSQNAAEFHASIERRFAARTIDRQEMLLELGLALEQAQHEGSTQLAARIQEQRGRLLFELGSHEAARSDLAAVAAAGAGSRSLALTRIELELAARDPAAGRKLAQEWLAAHADDAEAWRLRGDLERLDARALRDGAVETAGNELLSEDSEAARKLIDELSGRAQRDPRRISLANDLRTLFGTRSEAAAESVLDRCDKASAANALARSAFGRSLQLDFQGRAMGSLGALLERAGLGEEALDLFSAGWRVPTLREDADACATLLAGLRMRERWRYGNVVSGSWMSRHPASPDFLLDACLVAYGSMQNPDRDPGRLYNCGYQLFQVRTTELGDVPWFFMGEANYQIGGHDYLEAARSMLGTYTASDSPEPVPHARAIAWRHLADACRTLGLAAEERTALEGAAELAPEHDGETWLRLAELQLAAPRGGYRVPDERWARGMKLLPQRTAELMSRWEEIGQLELRSLGLDANAIRADLRNGLTVAPTSNAAPYELYTLARVHLEEGKLSEARTFLGTLLEQLPGFVPALDLQLDLARARGKSREIVEAFLARLERTGNDERSRALLATLPEDTLLPADQRRVLRADPEGAGRLAVARALAARGEPRQALELLLQVPESALDLEQRVFAASLELLAGESSAACDRLLALREDVLERPGALEILVDAALRAGRGAELAEPLAKLLPRFAPDRARYLALSDRLLAGGQPALARTFAARLDGAGKAFRGGDVLVRLAASALALRQETSLAAALERAAAFDTRGDAELVALLALGDDAGESSVRDAVLALRKTNWAHGPRGGAAQALFGGDPDDLRARLQALGDDPLRSLFAATLEDAPRATPREQRAAQFVESLGPRGLAALVLGLERPWLASFVLARLDAAGEKAGAVWPHWFRALLHRAAHERGPEQRELRAVLAADRRFAPAWQRLIELADDPRSEGLPDLELCLQRDAALGDAAVAASDLALDRARAQMRDGQLEPALEAARTAATAAPDSGPVLLVVGRLYAQLGRTSEALATYRRALQRLPAASGAESTREMLELCQLAHVASPPLYDAEGLRAALEQLAQVRPDDPRVLLAQAQNDLETSVPDQAFGVARAYARLERVRSDHPQPFERLARGSTESWTRFLLALDPARARSFLDAELEREPGNLDAWVLLARGYFEEGRPEEALREIARVQRISPGPTALREYLRVRSQSDWTVEGIVAVAERWRSAARLAPGDPAGLALEARALLRLGPRGVPKALQITSGIDPARVAALPADERAEFLWARAIALLARAQPDDLAQARGTIDELAKLWPNAERVPLVAALRGLSRSAATPAN